MAGHVGAGAVGAPARPVRRYLPETLARLRGSLLAMAADVLSGPGGLAAWLRQSQLTGPGAGPSLPLDVPLPLDAGEAGRPSRRTCAAPPLPATRTAPSPAAASHPASARSTT